MARGDQPSGGDSRSPRITRTPQVNGGLDTSVAYSARVNNYWQGGKDNFAADRQAAEQALEAYPDLPLAVRASGRFRGKAISYLVHDVGLRQFLDLGTGMPAGDPVHKIAQSLVPECRVVYVDNDPMVISHARALFASAPSGSCGFVQGDVRAIDGILATAAQTLDFTRPVGVILSALLHLIPDSGEAYRIVRRAMDQVAPGSHLVVVHPASDIHPEASADLARLLNELVAQKRKYRSHAEVSAFFAGLDLVPPGVVTATQWRPESEFEAKGPAMTWCGIGRKA